MRRMRFALAAMMAGLVFAASAPTIMAQAPTSEQEALQLGIEAYIYGYPLLTMEMTRRVMTNVVTVQGTRGPMGSFTNARAYPTAAFRDVTAPNADTLYSIAWLDLAKEPQILSVPDEDGRYYLMPILPAGPTYSRFRASGPPGPRRGNSPSPDRAGRENCPMASPNSDLPRAWSGFSVELTAPGRRRTTRPSMPSRINIPSSR